MDQRASKKKLETDLEQIHVVPVYHILDLETVSGMADGDLEHMLCWNVLTHLTLIF